MQQEGFKLGDSKMPSVGLYYSHKEHLPLYEQNHVLLRTMGGSHRNGRK